MSKYINPFTDAGFKRIFGCEVNKDLLIDFLNQVLKGHYAITDLTFLNKERIPESQEFRAVIYDIYCQTDKGESIIVEMQNAHQSFFKKRSLYYVARAIVDQGEPGKAWNYDIKTVVGVFLLNDDAKNDTKLKTDVMLKDVDTNDVAIDSLFMTFIRLPLFKKELEECENDFERWIYVLKNMENLERMPATLQNDLWEKLFEVCDVRNMSREDYDKYEYSLKIYRDIKDNENYWRNEVKESRAEGEKRGREEGRKEEKIALAKNFKSQGFPIQAIAMGTGLSAEEIAKL